MSISFKDINKNSNGEIIKGILSPDKPLSEDDKCKFCEWIRTEKNIIEIITWLAIIFIILIVLIIIASTFKRRKK